MTLHAALRENAMAFPDRPWLHCETRKWTYAEGNAISNRIAVGLMRAGVQPGDRVALLFTNCAEIVFCYFACFKIGAVAVPIRGTQQGPHHSRRLEHLARRS